MNRIALPISIFLILALQAACFGQSGDLPANQLGFGLQVYPAGVIPTISLEHYLSPNTGLLFRVGGNFTDRKDFSSENDKEKGGGFGGSAGLRKHIPMKRGGVVLGVHTDLWNLWIDWGNAPGGERPLSGTTYTLVLQPWLEAGYVFPFKSNRSRFGLSLGFGREINLVTDGRAVEQDWIGSARIYYQFSL